MKKSRKQARVKAHRPAKHGSGQVLPRKYGRRVWFMMPAIIFILGVACFCWLATMEAPLVYALYQHPWVNFEKFMARSIYEGGGFGGSDVGVTLGILIFLVWLARRGANSKKFFFTLQELKFIWMSSLFASVFFVHSFKWIFSRLRPKIFFAEASQWTTRGVELAALKWPGFLPFDAPRGTGWNSFPSGHVASASILLCYSYIFYRKNGYWGLAVGLLVFLYCVAMSLARSMGGMHWLSDGVASFFGGWVIIHIFAEKMKINGDK